MITATYGERSVEEATRLPGPLAHLVEDPGSPAGARALVSQVRQELEARAPELGEEAAVLHHHLGLLLELRYGDPEQALVNLEAAAALAPGRAGLNGDLRRIQWQEGRWEQVLALLQVELDGTVQAQERAWIHLQRGQVLELGLEQPEAAHKAYLAALDEVADPQVLLKLRRTMLARGDFQELINVCGRWANQAQDPWLCALLWRQVGLLEELCMGRPGEAVAAYRAAVELEPGERANTEPLARTLQQMERWGGLVDLLVAEADAEAEGPRQRDLLLRAAQIKAHRLGKPSAGQELASAALAGRPGYLLTLMGLAQAPPRGEELEQLLEDLERQLASWTAPERRAALHLTIGRLCAEAPGMETRATRHLLSATHLAPDLHEAHPLLLSLGLRAGRWRAAATACEALLKHTEDREARLWLLRCRAELQALALGDLSGAADTLEQALVQEAGALFALDARAWLLDPAEDPRGLEQALGRMVQRITDGDTAAALLSEAGDALAFAGASADALIYHQRACQQTGARRPTLEALERWAMVRGDIDSIVTALQGRIDLTDAPAARAALLFRLGLCHEASGELDLATNCLEEAASLEEGWLVLWEMARIALMRQRPDTAAATLRRLSEISVSPEITSACVAAAEILAGDPRPVGGAKPRRAVDPDHAARLATKGRWEDAAEAWEAVLRETTDHTQRQSANRALGGLYAEVLTRPAEALAAWQNVLEGDPEDEEAQGAVYRLLVGSAAWHDAARFLGWLLEADLPPAERAAHLQRLARLSEDRFDDPRQAVTLLRQAQELQPTREEVLNELVRLLESQERWSEQADAIRTFLAALPTDDRKRGVSQMMALGQLLKDRLEAPEEALEQYRAVVKFDPANTEAHLAAALLLEEQGAQEAAGQAHEDLLRLDPLNLESLSRASVLWTGSGRQDRTLAVESVLALMEGGPSRTIGTLDGPPARALRGAGTGAMEATLAHKDEDAAAMRVLDMIGPAADDLPVDFRRPAFSGSATPLSEGSGHPVQRQVVEVCRLLGVAVPARLLMAVGVRGGVCFHASRLPGLVVERSLDRSDRQGDLRRALARALAYHRTFGGPGGLWLAHQEAAPYLDQLLLAAGMAVRAPVTSNVPKITREMGQVLMGTMSSDQTRTLDQRFGELRSDRWPDLAQWAAAMQATADRCALWITGDLTGVLGDLRDRLGTRPEASLPDWCADEPAALDLIRFWLFCD